MILAAKMNFKIIRKHTFLSPSGTIAAGKSSELSKAQDDSLDALTRVFFQIRRLEVARSSS